MTPDGDKTKSFWSHWLSRQKDSVVFCPFSQNSNDVFHLRVSRILQEGNHFLEQFPTKQKHMKKCTRTQYLFFLLEI